MDIKDTLVLNSDGQPLSLLPLSTFHWERAIKDIWTGSVRVIEEYEDWQVHSPTVTMTVPSIVMTKFYVDIDKTMSYSPSNIYLRDNYKCQYCYKRFPESQLTIDHVLPQSFGGKSTWENTTTSCSPCNNSRGNNRYILPLTKPHRPSYYKLIDIRKKNPLVIPHHSWKPYLGWDESMIKVIERRK